MGNISAGDESPKDNASDTAFRIRLDPLTKEIGDSMSLSECTSLGLDSDLKRRLFYTQDSRLSAGDLLKRLMDDRNGDL